MPDTYFRRVVKESIGKDLGPLNSYGTGIVFIPPKSEAAVAAIKDVFETQVKQLGFSVIGWRDIETGYWLYSHSHIFEI